MRDATQKRHSMDKAPLDQAIVQTLVSNHKKFLGFVERRIGNREIAEEIIQNAFVKTIEKGCHIQDGEGAVTWFYRLLRNAMIDYFRRANVETNAWTKMGDQDSDHVEIDQELQEAICACINDLIPTIKDDYSILIEKIDLEGESIAKVSKELNMTANNTMVKLHRARQALKRQLERSCGTCATHGCLDCGCKKKSGNAE